MKFFRVLFLIVKFRNYLKIINGLMNSKYCIYKNLLIYKNFIL